MALKVGEKEVGTSIASLSQRRGVTPAYTGDALASAAENIGKTVNTFQARAAELLDLEYRTKADADATKRITELSRDENYRYDPDKFMAAANAYLEKAVEQAPSRYKAWVAIASASTSSTIQTCARVVVGVERSRKPASSS